MQQGYIDYEFMELGSSCKETIKPIAYAKYTRGSISDQKNKNPYKQSKLVPFYFQCSLVFYVFYWLQTLSTSFLLTPKKTLQNPFHSNLHLLLLFLILLLHSTLLLSTIPRDCDSFRTYSGSGSYKNKKKRNQQNQPITEQMQNTRPPPQMQNIKTATRKRRFVVDGPANWTRNR